MAKIDYPEEIHQLILELKALPGIGIRSAERIATWLLQEKEGSSEALAAALLDAKQAVHSCEVCGFFVTEKGCSVCQHPRREPVICVVERATDVLPIERSGVFSGKYHCLGGRLSPLDNVTPEDLRIDSLLARVLDENERIEEVILALGADVEGEATANYLLQLLQGKCRVTRLAQGLPVGGGLEHADALTLAKALEGRR